MIRTLKQRLYRWFSEKNSLKWTTIVQKIADGINASECRATGLAPSAVNHGNAEAVWQRVYGEDRRQQERPPKRYALNTAVRIDKAKGAFHKAYLPGYVEIDFFNLKSRCSLGILTKYSRSAK